MQRLFSLIVAVILLLTFMSCGTKNNNLGNLSEAKQSSIESSANNDSISSANEVDSIRENIEAVAVTNYYNFDDNFSSEHKWATKIELQEFKSILSSIKLNSIEKLVAVSGPNDNDIIKPLSVDQATSIMTKLKAIEPTVFSKPENPMTGGALGIYIVTSEQKISISFLGNLLNVAVEGNPQYWIFDASTCEDECHDILGIVNNILAASAKN